MNMLVTPLFSRIVPFKADSWGVGPFLSITTESFFDKNKISSILIRLDCYVICDHKTLHEYLRTNPLGIWISAIWFLCPRQLMWPHNLLSNVQRLKRDVPCEWTRAACSRETSLISGDLAVAVWETVLWFISTLWPNTRNKEPDLASSMSSRWQAFACHSMCM